MTIPALIQYIKLWRLVEAHGVQLQPGMEDVVSWRWSPDRSYTARSAYRMFFQGATRFAEAQQIWHAWAPLKVKFFTWLAVRKRIWTGDRRHRHGLQDSVTACPLCDQEPETVDHLFITCPYTRTLWHTVIRMLGDDATNLSATELLDWWLQLRRGHNRNKQRGIDSVVMLVTWCTWKERNNIIFRSRPPMSESQTISAIVEEGRMWVTAGAKWMAALGWPEPAARIA